MYILFVVKPLTKQNDSYKHEKKIVIDNKMTKQSANQIYFTSSSSNWISKIHVNAYNGIKKKLIRTKRNKAVDHFNCNLTVKLLNKMVFKKLSSTVFLC